MSENNEAGSFATAGSGKSEAEVAFDLLSKLKGQGVWGERNINAILDMYAECLDAAKGLRAYEGQNRVEVATSKSTSQTVAQPAQQQMPQQTQAQMAQPQQAVQPVQAQPIHAQQQQLQQAYNQG